MEKKENAALESKEIVTSSSLAAKYDPGSNADRARRHQRGKDFTPGGLVFILCLC